MSQLCLWFLLVSLAMQNLSCSQKPRPAEAQLPAPGPKPQATSAVVEKPPLPPFAKSTFPAGPRVVAVGDLHGDFEATQDVLRLVGATDEQNSWIGEKLTLVQTGDQLDRGDGERAILDLLVQLQDQAGRAGGNVVILSGNHETMNVGGDFRYVTERGFAEFQGADPRPLPENLLRQLPPHSHPRAAAFFPGGSYARKMAGNPVVAIVGDSVFAHGGVRMSHVSYGLDRLNAEVRDWFLGERRPPELVLAEDAPVWTRLYSDGQPSAEACRELTEVLTSLGVKRMVVGHTVQKSGISSACEGKVWRIDVGMSAYYQGGIVSALEIANGNVRVLERQKRTQK